MPELYLGTIAIAPLIVALIAVLKWLGLPANWAPLANIILSALFVLVIGYVGIEPSLLSPATTILNVLIAVLGAAGFYDLGSNVVKRS